MSPKTIGDYMTKSPVTIGVEQSLRRAHEVMREHAIRHLPVLRGGQLVGVVSQRDLHLIEALSDVRPDAVPVEDAMIEAAFAVAPAAPIREVVAEMAERKLGCAVVMKGAHVVGIFTTVDALRALKDACDREAAA